LKVGDEEPVQRIRTQQDRVDELLQSDIGAMKDLVSPEAATVPDLTSPIKTRDALTPADIERLKAQVAELRRKISAT